MDVEEFKQKYEELKDNPMYKNFCSILDTKNQVLERISKENQGLKKQLEYLHCGEYLNQLRFERNMLQDVVDKMEVSKEDKRFIDMTHRNTELLEENRKLEEQLEVGEQQYNDLVEEKEELQEQLSNSHQINAQQKEFIEYLEDKLNMCDGFLDTIKSDLEEISYAGRASGKTYIATQIMKNEIAMKCCEEVLSKYKEIIGYSE